MARVFSIASSAKRVTDAFKSRFPTARESRSSHEVAYYDTFDWALYRAGYTLSEHTADGRRTLWLASFDGTTRHRLPSHAAPTFASELPDGPFREALSQRSTIRRLLPLVRLRLRQVEIPVVDDQQKTVARLRVERGQVSEVPNGHRKRLRPALVVDALRGYESEAERLAAFASGELSLEPGEPSALVRALAACGQRPADVDTKFRVSLERGMPAGVAVRRILTTLLDSILLNEDGTRRDLDSEFLHDFRVAVRRTRSALGQLGDVFAASEIERFRDDFKWLGQLTGPSRDLDVHLLTLPRYRELLAEDLHDDLRPLEQLLRCKKAEAHEALVAGFDSDRYRALRDDWRAFLEDARHTNGAGATRAVEAVADERIRRALRRVVRRGGKIHDGSPASKLHRLRIDCKKLRYLLEMFASLYDRKEIGRFIQALKKLQDNLGDFNDYEVQQDALEAFAGELSGDGVDEGRALLAVGRLLDRLDQSQDAERRQFQKRFSRFASRSNRKRAAALFGDGGDAA